MDSANEWSEAPTRKKYNALVWIVGSTLCSVIVFLAERVINEDAYCREKRADDAVFYKEVIAELKVDNKTLRLTLDNERFEHLERLSNFETEFWKLKRESDSLKNRRK